MDKGRAGSAIGQELYLVNCLINDNSKEYQLWNYKKDIVQACIDLGIPH